MKIQFSTGNAAFDEYGDTEVRRILEEIANKVEYGYDHGSIMDINGNNIGSWEL
jgi:hypothetical protein